MRMPRPVAVVELGMEAVAGIARQRRALAPLYERILESGDEAAIEKAESLATTLYVAGLQVSQLVARIERAQLKVRRSA